MGLIQRAIETIGIPTISISILKEYTEKVNPPRAIYLKWPFGHPLGEPGHRDQQAAVLARVFEEFESIQEPGRIVDVGWHWRRETYPPSPWHATPSACRAA